MHVAFFIFLKCNQFVTALSRLDGVLAIVGRINALLSLHIRAAANTLLAPVGN